jgi:hypothetical protein
MLLKIQIFVKFDADDDAVMRQNVFVIKVGLNKSNAKRQLLTSLKY